tara:strand:- start:387 stop:1646 length:1260 start_codon:yes stop_codon:yes gene_type:complete
MRLSSLQVYQQSLNGINKASVEIAQTQNQLTTGQRVNIASDDPVAAARILAIDSELNNISGYQKNIDAIDARLKRTEAVLTNIETILNRLNELVIQADGAGLTNIERRNIAIEISERVLELASLTNSQDENGDYIFSGFLNNAPAYTLEEGRYRYQGDNGIRHEKISEQLTVASSDNGFSLFENFDANEFLPEVEVGLTTGPDPQTLSVQVLSQEAYDLAVANGGDQGYVFKFNLESAIIPIGPNYSIYRISDGVLVSDNNPYVASLGLLEGGLKIDLSSTPLTGDTFTVRPIKHTNMLNIVKEVGDRIAAFEEPSSTNNRGEESEFDQFIADTLDALSAVQERVRSSRTDIGARMNTLTAASSNQESLALAGKQILSVIRDVDYNEAVSRLSFQTLVLETTQQSFVKIANLSLFNYLK